MANNDVKIVITGQDVSGSKALRGVREEADHASRSFGGLKSAVGLASGALAGLSVGAGLAGAVKAAGNLQQAVANISTIKPEINTSAVFASLNEMQRRVPQSASQLASSLYDIFSSMDVGQDAALRLTETFAKGATAASTDAQTFGTAIMGVMNAYGASVEDAAHISDVFFNTVNRGVVTGQELASSLGPVTQSAKAAGVSIDELGALIAGVTKEGGPAAQNINNLNNFLAKVSTKEAREEIAKLGVATTDSAGNFRPIVDVLTDLKPRLERMTEAQRANALQAIFPDAQARQGAMTLISQLDTVKAALASNRAAVGTTEDAYRRMAATFNSQLAILKNTATSILTQIGAMALPHLTPLLTAFATALPQATTAGGAALTALWVRAQPVLETMRSYALAWAAGWSNTIRPLVTGATAGIAAGFEQARPALEQFGRVLADELLPRLIMLGAVLGAALGPVARDLAATLLPLLADGALLVARGIAEGLDQILLFAEALEQGEPWAKALAAALVAVGGALVTLYAVEKTAQGIEALSAGMKTATTSGKLLLDTLNPLAGASGRLVSPVRDAAAAIGRHTAEMVGHFRSVEQPVHSLADVVYQDMARIDKDTKEAAGKVHGHMQDIFDDLAKLDQETAAERLVKVKVDAATAPVGGAGAAGAEAAGKSFAGQFADALGRALPAALVAAGPKIAAGIVAFVPVMALTIAENLGMLLVTLLPVAIVPAVGALVLRFREELWNGLKAAVGAIPEALGAVAGVAMGALVLALAAPFIAGFKLGEWIAQAATAVDWGAIGGAISAGLSAAVSAAGAVAGGALDLGGMIAGALVEGAAAAAEGAADALLALPGLVADLPGALAGLLMDLPGLAAGLPGALAELVLSLPSLIVDLPERTGAVFQLAVDRAGEILGTLAGKATEAVGGVIGAITASSPAQAVASFMGQVADGFTTGWNAVNALTGGALNEVVGKVEGAFTTMKSGVTLGIAAVVTTVAGLPGRITGALGSLASLLYNAGREVIQGLIDGIESKLGDLGGMVARAANLIPDTLKGILHIKSPSKLMADEIGVPIVQGIMAGVESQLPELQRQLQDVSAAIARTRLALAGAEIGSAHAKGLQSDLKVLEAWKKQIQDQITVEKEWQQSLLDAATALDYFNNQMGQIFSGAAQKRMFGAEGADIVSNLLAALEDPAAGARVAEGLGRLLSSDAFKNLPGAAELGAQLEDAIFGALAERTPEAYAAVTELLAGLQGRFDAAGTLSGATFGEAFGRAMAAEDNLNRFGQTGAQLIDAFTAAIDKGGVANIEQAGKFAADLMDTLRDKLPPKEAGKIGAQLFEAFQQAADEKTPEALDKLKAFVEQTNGILSMIPKNMRELVPELQAAILAIIELFRDGAISAEEAGKRINAAIDASEEKAREAKKQADEAKRKSSAGSGFTPLPSSSTSFEDISGGEGEGAVRGTERTNAGGFAGLTHTTLSSGNWQVELFSVTAALLAASSQFMAAAKKGALPGGTDLSAALGFTSGAAYKQWAEVMKEQADATALRWGAAGREAKGEWGGGVLGGMSDSEFDAFLGTLGTGAERDRARAEREQAQREQTGAARTQEKAADWQVQAAESNKKSAASIEATGAVMNEAAKESRRAAEEARKAAEEARQKDNIDDAEDDEEERERRRRRRREEENRDNTAPGNAPGVPAHSGGGIIDEFAYLVNAAGRTIGTMSESAPEAIMPMPLLRGAMAVLASGETAPGPSAMQSPVGGAGVAVQIGHAVAAALAGMTVEMDGQTVGRLVSPYVSREIARDALLAGVNR